MTCGHGQEIGAQGGVQQSQIDVCRDDLDWLLGFYSACDCCDYLMHHDSFYWLLADGRMLCHKCYRGERLAVE